MSNYEDSRVYGPFERINQLILNQIIFHGKYNQIHPNPLHGTRWIGAVGESVGRQVHKN